MTEEKILSLVSSLLPIVLTILFAWLSSRNEDAKRRGIIEEAKQRVDLIQGYIRSQDFAIDDPQEKEMIKKTAAKELYEIKAFLDKRMQSLEKVSTRSDNFLQRFFLLYKMRTLFAKFFRACFYFMFLISLIWSITIPGFAFTSAAGVENSTLVGILASLMLVLPFIFVVLLVRWLAVRLDKPLPSAR